MILLNNIFPVPVHRSFFILTPEEKSISVKNALCSKVSFPTFTYAIRIYFTFQPNKHSCLYGCVKATHISWNITYLCYISWTLIFSKIFYFRKSDYHPLNLFCNLLMGQNLRFGKLWSWHIWSSSVSFSVLFPWCSFFDLNCCFWHCKDVWFSLILK